MPMSHWGMPYVEHLIAAGRLADPAPLTRPLREADVVRALEGMDTLGFSGGERGVVQALLADLQRHEQGPWGRLDADLGVAAATHAFRDPLAVDRSPFPGGDTPRAFASGGLALRLGFGPVVAVTHPYLDTRLKYDPDWFGKKDRVIAGRTAESYVGAQWSFGELLFGRLDRNWGPSVTQGALLSDNAYGLDHLGLTLGTSGIQLQAFVTQLDTRPDSIGVLERRYLVAHRLWLRPPGRWTVALWEGSVLSGPDRTIEPWFLNVMNVAFLEQVNSGTNVNTFFGLDFERRARVTVYGQLMLDDIQVDRTTLTDQKPSSYLVTLGARGPFLSGAGAWTLFYSQVANLTYRNEDNLQVPLYHSLGTGRNFADYDQATARFSVLAAPSLLLSPEVTLVRQGEGDPRLAHPAPPGYPATATLFAGVVQRTVRLALSLRWGGRPLQLTGDAGVHLVSNDGHVSGVSKTRFVGAVGVELHLHREGQLP